MILRPTVLILPGLYNSGPKHWQSVWEKQHPEYRRVQQRDWETPSCAEWIATLDAAVTSIAGPVVLVGHSTACAATAHWAGKYKRALHGALLVGPSDVEATTYPAGPTGFSPMPLARLPFRSILVFSEDDPYVTPSRARFFAEKWGSEPVNIGKAGHINSDSGLGEWQQGQRLLAELMEK